MITRLSENDKSKAVMLYEQGVHINHIRMNLIPFREVAQKTVRNAVLEGGYGAVGYCTSCQSYQPFISAVRGGREFCNECGKYE